MLSPAEDKVRVFVEGGAEAGSTRALYEQRLGTPAVAPAPLFPQPAAVLPASQSSFPPLASESHAAGSGSDSGRATAALSSLLFLLFREVGEDWPGECPASSALALALARLRQPGQLWASKLCQATGFVLCVAARSCLAGIAVLVPLVGMWSLVVGSTSGLSPARGVGGYKHGLWS